MDDSNITPDNNGGEPEGLPPVPAAATPAAAPGVTDQVAALQAEIDRMKQSIQVNAGRPPMQQSAQPGQQPDRRALEQQFWSDPIGSTTAISHQVAVQTAEQLRGMVAPTLEQYARDQVRGRDPEIFDRYAAEIEAAVGLVAPAARGSVDVWLNAFNLIRGKHVDDIMQIKAANGGVRGAPATGPQPPSPKASPAPKKEELKAEERDFARKFRISEDDYRRGKQRYENQDKSWDEVLTFDSAARTRSARNNPTTK